MFIICYVVFSLSGKAQVFPIIKQDTVVRFISNTTKSTWYNQLADQHPFPCILIRVQRFGYPTVYFKKMRKGWKPIPNYYKVWEE